MTDPAPDPAAAYRADLNERQAAALEALRRCVDSAARRDVPITDVENHARVVLEAFGA